MSDFFEVREKTVEGAQWRGSISLTHETEEGIQVERQLTVRQLRDPEFFKVMKMIDRDELNELQDNMPKDLMNEYNELQDQEELDEEEVERLSELEDEIEAEAPNMFEVLSEETFNGIRKAGEYGVEPDPEDLRKILYEYADEVEEAYDVEPKSDADDCVYNYFKEYLLPDMLDKSTDFQSFVIGMEVLVETMGGEEGN